MTSLTVLRLVAEREVRDRIGNRAFQIGSLVTLLVLIAIVVGPALLTDDGPTTIDLGVAGTTSPGFEDAAISAGRAQDAEVTVTAYDSRAEADAAIASGEVDAVVIDESELLVEDEASNLVQSITQQAVQQSQFLLRLSEAGVSGEQASELLQGSAPLAVVTPTGSADEREAGFGVAFFATVLLFIMIQINGSSLLTGTIEEKSSRVVEVLLGSVRPWQLLAGKLLGISLLAFLQLATYAAVTLGLNEAVGGFDLPEAAGPAVALGLMMFVLGFGFFAALYAVAGAMASSIEDAQSSAGPLGFLTVGVYMAVIIGVIPNPDGLLARVLTFLPPSAPFAVPARVAAGSVPGWEIALAAVITAAGTVGAIRLAGRLYSAAILSGGTLTWRAVLKAEPIR